MNTPTSCAMREKNDLVPFNLADFYKTAHPSMYPAATTKLVANFTPRSAKYAPVLKELFDNKVVWFGLQGFIQAFLIDLFDKEFFRKPKEPAVRTGSGVHRRRSGVDRPRSGSI